MSCATSRLSPRGDRGQDGAARALRARVARRAVAGRPLQLNIMYGLAGERRLTELELDWLPGYEGAKPVRIGNAAYRQFQLDVFGEVMDALHQVRRVGLPPDDNAWRVQRALMGHRASAWEEPDEGIWEVRGPRRHFTHSKVMAWVAFDRAIKAVEQSALDGPRERWRRLRAAVHDEVCRQGYDADRNTFVQSYGGKELDASLLMIPLVGFLPPGDPRFRGTVEAIERDLLTGGRSPLPDPARRRWPAARRGRVLGLYLLVGGQPGPPREAPTGSGPLRAPPAAVQ
jgi:GH15 family glucan-1,4-alpha-glucosidase